MVKISDKIAYLGRDIEDAIRMDFIGRNDMRKLKRISTHYGEDALNTTVIIHDFITSICENSSPESGIRLSDEYNKMLLEIKEFNYDKIYRNPKFNVYRKYAALVIRSIYDTLVQYFDHENSINRLTKIKKTYPKLIGDFTSHLISLSSLDAGDTRHLNNKVYGKLESKEIYVQAIIDYISGMTDRYAVEIFNELLRY